MALIETAHQGERKTVVIFDHFGPYHLARLEAAAKKVALTAIECASSSLDYAWNRMDRRTNFNWITLFQDDRCKYISARKLTAAVRRALAEARPEIVAIPGWSSRVAFIALQWSLEHKVPVLVMSDSNTIDAERYWPKEAIKKRVISLVSSALAGGSRSAQYVVQLGMPRKRVFVGYDVVDNQHFIEGSQRARENATELRRKLCLPRQYFLASARFIPKKNLSLLLQAYSRYRSLFGEKAWKLVILGDGPLRDRLYTERDRLGLDQDVSFPGFLQYDLLPTYYGLADAFVHTSVVEQWGLVVNEALAARLPVLVSNRCGCAPELIRDGYNGFVFDPLDVKRLADLMVHLSDHPSLIQMGCNGQEIINRWSVDTFAESITCAADAALAAGSARLTLLDKVLLRALSAL